jgi:group I intron endonuclease
LYTVPVSEYYVYCWTCSTNGKQYVGKGKGLRATSHLAEARRGTGSVLHAAMRKHGPESFVLEYLAMGLSEAEAHRLEIAYIASLSTKRPLGYNLTNGGEGVSGLKFSDQSRVLLSEINLARFSSKEERKKLSEAQIARWSCPEARRRQSERAARRRHSAETKAKMAKAHGPGSQHHPKGSEHGRAKLTEEQVRQIRSTHAAGGFSYATLGNQHNVTPELVSMIVRRKIWTHVE